MINEDRLIKQLLVHEGLKLQPYYCTSDKLTIGVGRNLQDIGISEDEAEYLLRNDIDRCISQCETAFEWYEEAPEMVQEAVINLVFNMGLSKFKAFKLTIGHLEAGRYELAGAELLNSRYAQQVGQRSIDVANQIASCQS